MNGSSTHVLAALAAEVGACVRPVLQRLTDTTSGETRIVSIPCAEIQKRGVEYRNRRKLCLLGQWLLSNM